MADTLTFDEIIATVKRLDDLRQVVYYGTTDAIDRGMMYKIDDYRTGESFFVLHPDDLDALKREYPSIRFVHLRDKPPLSRDQIVAEMNRRFGLREE